MGDVGAFDALIGNLSNIYIFVKGVFAPQCTTTCIFSIYVLMGDVVTF